MQGNGALLVCPLLQIETHARDIMTDLLVREIGRGLQVLEAMAILYRQRVPLPAEVWGGSTAEHSWQNTCLALHL